MQQAKTFFPNYAGTPVGFRRVGFHLPNGRAVVALFTAEPDWDISVFVEADTYRSFIIGTSPDKEKTCILRALRNHNPKQVDYASSGEQAAGLNGKTAATASHEELVMEAAGGLTNEDVLQPVVVPPLQLVEAMARPDDHKGRWDFHFRVTKETTPRTAAVCRLSPPMTMITKSAPAKLIQAFRNGPSQMYFLFDEDTEFFLECIRMYGHRIQRVEARATKAIHAGQTPRETVEAMAPSLA